jgi:hypothetical protein
MTAALSPTDDRLQAALTGILELLLPRVMGQLACFCDWEYRVVAVTPAVPGALPSFVSGVPVDVGRCPFGPLPQVPIWPGPDGSICVPKIGSIVVIGFHDGNPAKPAVKATDPTSPAIVPDVPPAKVSVAGLLATFATGLNPGTLAAQSATLVTALQLLL